MGNQAVRFSGVDRKKKIEMEREGNDVSTPSGVYVNGKL